MRCTAAAQQQVGEVMQPGHLLGSQAHSKAQEESWIWGRARIQRPAEPGKAGEAAAGPRGEARGGALPALQRARVADSRPDCCKLK